MPTCRAWEAQARADGLAERVRVLGFRNDVPHVLAGCDVMVHPARYEAYGLGVHEAVCRGLPVIVSASAGVAKRFPPELGGLLLGNPDDAGELADRLRTWRRDSAPGRPGSPRSRPPCGKRMWDDMSSEFVTAVGTP